MTRREVLEGGAGSRDPLTCGCGADPGLVPVDAALDRALGLARAVEGVETLPLHAATGRVTALPVRAARAMPPFDNAAMDGYGFDPGTLRGSGPWVLPVAGQARAGDAPGDCPAGAALRVLTGAAIPAGVAAVVPQEDVAADGARIVLRHPPSPGAHIRRAGCDLPAGAVVLPPGRVIGPREAAAAAAAGLGALAVHRRLRVAVLSTGSELRRPGEELGPGQIWDVNAAMLAAALARPWVDLRDPVTLPDDPLRIVAPLSAAAAGADLVVTSGGVSVGDADHVTAAVRACGGTVEVMRLAMKPGKPVTIGRIGRALWLGLPGNPVAAFVAWTVLGAPVAGRMAGLAEAAPRKQLARLFRAIAHEPGRCEYRPARFLGHDQHGVAVVDCLDAPGSHRVAQLAAAEALVLIPADAGSMAAGDLVEVLPV